MSEIGNSKRYDLEERTFGFAKAVRAFARKLPRTIANLEDVKQVIRSSGSIGANYIEANESVGRKDFVFRAKVCRKEAKETVYWLRLLDLRDVSTLEVEREILIKECIELTRIFGAIVTKSA